jgi:putative endonuclease
MSKHESSFYENSYTSSRLPVELIYQETFQFVQMAIDREKQIKRWSKQKKLALINKSYSDLSRFAKKEF